MKQFLWAVLGFVFVGVILLALICGGALAWLRGCIFPERDWSEADLASAWRKKQRAHVAGEPARLTPQEHAAWHDTRKRRRAAFNWGE